MGFFSEFNKALRGEPSGDKYKVAGYPITCPTCKGSNFIEGDALLDDRASSYFGWEAFGAGATILTCTTCGRVEWYANYKLIEKQ